MKKLLTSSQMKKCDEGTIINETPSCILMERAARSVCDLLCDKFGNMRYLCVCSSGNNGGDGILVAVMLSEKGYDCDIWYVGHGHRMTEETSKRYAEAEMAGVPFVEDPEIGEYDVIVDAVLGTGLAFAPEGLIKEAIEKIRDSEAIVVSVDIPSGISADNGKAYGSFVRADYTVTMQEYKRGHALAEGIDASGIISVGDIGVDSSYVEGETYPVCLEYKDLELIPRRRRDSHKGVFGRALVIAGKKGMSGAAYLSACAAYRCGAGIVEIFTCEENREILQILLPEAIVTAYEDPCLEKELLQDALNRATVIVIGPGIGTESAGEYLVKEVFRSANSAIIADADALNIVAKASLDYPTEVPVIITPHPGEFSRLTGRTVKEIAEDPWDIASEYAEENGVICVCKNARTAVTDGENIFVNMAGGPSMAKGGSGDVLTGVIAGLLCSGMSPIGAAAMGAFVHSLAGDVTAGEMGEHSPMARDILEALPKVLKGAKGKR